MSTTPTGHKIAAIITAYRYFSHADVIITKFLIPTSLGDGEEQLADTQ